MRETLNALYFNENIKKLKQAFDFGKWEVLSKEQSLKYCGGTISLHDHGIEMSYAEYMHKICPMTIQKTRKDTDEITTFERSKARGLIGALQWPATQGLPMLSASMSLQAGELAGGTVRELKELNKTLRFGKQNANVTVKFMAKKSTGRATTLDDLTLICYADAAFGVRKDMSSQGGYIVVACDVSVLKGEKRPGSMISWRSFKLPRVCRSSLAAECQACSTALDELMMAKLYLIFLQKPLASLAEGQRILGGKECALVTDCKALYDAVQRETIQQATDKRVAIEGLMIKGLLTELRCQWRWVSSERQLADGLTKVSARQAFVERFRGGFVQLVADESYQASKKKTKADRERTIQETRGSASQVAQSLIALVMAECATKSDATAEGDVTMLSTCAANREYDNVISYWVCMWLALGIAFALCLAIYVFKYFRREADSESRALRDELGETSTKLVRSQEANQRLLQEIAGLKSQQSRLEHQVQNLQDQILRVENDPRGRLHHRPHIWTTVGGECWHSKEDCRTLLNSSHLLERRPCSCCVDV